jgi:hypothetical protein
MGQGQGGVVGQQGTGRRLRLADLKREEEERERAMRERDSWEGGEVEGVGQAM